MNNLARHGETPVISHARLLRALHELDLQGKNDSDEADAVRDEIDGPWYAMTQQERDRIGGLSEDFYGIAEGGPPMVAMNAAELDAWKEDLRESRDRYLQGDIDAWLAFWRTPRPRDFPPPQGLPLAVIRLIQAICWENLGDPDNAALFRKDAERLLMEQLARVA